MIALPLQSFTEAMVEGVGVTLDILLRLCRTEPSRVRATAEVLGTEKVRSQATIRVCRSVMTNMVLRTRCNSKLGGRVRLALKGTHWHKHIPWRTEQQLWGHLAFGDGNFDEKTGGLWARYPQHFRQKLV